jgi:citrate lyase synthetase
VKIAPSARLLKVPAIGAAALLIQHIINWSREQRLDRLVLHASTEGRALYKRLGFIATKEMKFADD